MITGLRHMPCRHWIHIWGAWGKRPPWPSTTSNWESWASVQKVDLPKRLSFSCWATEVCSQRPDKVECWYVQQRGTSDSNLHRNWGYSFDKQQIPLSDICKRTIYCRVLSQLKHEASNDLERYETLQQLSGTNTQLFFYTIIHNLKQLAPVIYTPTVGEACQKFDSIYQWVLFILPFAWPPAHNINVKFNNQGIQELQSTA